MQCMFNIKLRSHTSKLNAVYFLKYRLVAFGAILVRLKIDKLIIPARL